MIDLVYDNWGNAIEIDRLYEELEVRFYLTTSTASAFQIKELVGWDSLNFVHKRDLSYHGFNYEFTDENVTVGFDTEAGMEAVEAEYALNGNDGFVLLEKVLMYAPAPGGKIVEYAGRLNLNTRKREKYYTTATVERQSLHQSIQSRLSTKLNLSESVTLDEAAMSPPPLQRCYLPSRSITQHFHSAVDMYEEVFFSKPKDGDLWVHFNTANPNPNQISKTYPKQLNVSEKDPLAYDEFLFKFDAAGQYTIEVELDYQIYFKIHPRLISIGKKITGYTTGAVLLFRRPGKFDLDYTLIADVTGDPNATSVTISSLTCNTSQTLNVLAGDEVYVYAPFAFTHNANELSSIEMRVTSYNTIVNVTGNSKAEGTVAQGLLIKSALDAAVQKMTGTTNRIRSAFLSKANESQPTDGCGANLLLTNGGRIRNAEADKFPLTLTFEDTLSDLQALYNVGMGYEWDDDNQQEVIRLEPAGYFFQDVEIMSIQATGEFTEEVAREMIYNQIEVGYQKYNEEDANSLDEVHAYHEYQTPIQSEKNRYIQRCKAIASGYLLETTRRTQFSDDPKKATSYDDDLFLLHVKDAPTALTYDIELFIGAPTPTYLPRINFGARPVDGDGNPVDIRVNSLITLAGTSANDGTYTVTDVIDLLDYIPNPTYSVYVSRVGFVVTNEIATDVSVIFYEYEPVRDEPFESITNLLDPPSALNLLLTPKRMLLNHSNWLLGGLMYKGKTTLIKNTFVKQNGDLTTQIDSAYPCPGGDQLGLSLQEKADVPLEAFGYTESLFSPEWVQCKTRLSKNQFRYIITALRGGNGEGKNYGYLTIDGDKGDPVSGWPYEIHYNLSLIHI